jgi:hypothetical protein
MKLIDIAADLVLLLEAVSPDADEFLYVGDSDDDEVGIQRYSPGGAAVLDEPLDLEEALSMLDDYRFRLAYRLDRIAQAMERLGIEDGFHGEDVKEYVLGLAAKYEEAEDDAEREDRAEDS